MTDLQRIISNTLRWGVAFACLLALIGGAFYLWEHGTEPVQDFSSFARPVTTHTDFFEIFSAAWQGQWLSMVQVGVICLILTPIFRVFLSFLDFFRERNWLYASISAIVLAIIIVNSVAGIK